MVILWTHCRGRASDREEKRNSPGSRENRGPQKTKNDTTEASMLLKTKKDMSEKMDSRFRGNDVQGLLFLRAKRGAG